MFWQFCLFLGFWFLVSGRLDWQHFLYGSVASLFLVWLWRGKSERVVSCFSLRKVWTGLTTIGRLLREIWSASWQVARLVLSRNIVIEPSLVHITSKLKTDRMRMLFANSITLTPGTLTVQLKDDQLLIHALTKQSALDVMDWSFEDCLQRLEECN
jgi:multicomponent Na+:H+ antiporter subunit E